MKLEFNGHQYQVSLTDNATVKDIVANLPLKLTLKRYDDHEFPGELPFTPQKSEGTSTIKTGHLYYWDGWNSFVLNYKDMNIALYKVIELGVVDQPDELTRVLTEGSDTIPVTLTN